MIQRGELIIVDRDHMCPGSPRFRLHYRLIYLPSALSLLMTGLQMLPSESSSRLAGKHLEEAGVDFLGLMEGPEEAEADIGEP